MPNFNGKGPNGDGPMTGRKRGRCSGNQISDFTGFGRGQRYGRGLGFGQGRGMRNSFLRDRQNRDLETYQKDLESELKAVKEELKQN